MLGHRIRIKQKGYPVAAKFIDFLSINLSVILCSYLLTQQDCNAIVNFSVLFSIVFLLMGEYAGIYSYRINRLNSKDFIRFVGAYVLSFLIMETFRNSFNRHHFSRLWDSSLPLSWLLPYVVPIFILLIIRFVFFKQYQKKKIRVAILGMTQTGLVTEHELVNQYGAEKVEFSYYDDRGQDRFGYLTHSVYRGKMDDLLEHARKGEVDEVYIALPMSAVERIRHFLGLLSDTTVNTFIVPDIYSYSRYTTEVLMIGNMQAISILGSPFDDGGAIIKRAEDLIIGGLITLLILPIMLLIAIGIKLTSRGPVIFKQNRYGLSGQKITVYKFRSMRVMENADVVIQATRNDPRVTRFGSFLRRTSLDELPQFINVLQGRMSIVGPRPHAIAHNEEFRKIIDNYMIRHKVKPGITGWAQVNGYRGEVDTLDKMEKRIQYDIDYIQGWSLWLDIKIICQTITKGFSGENAY